MFKKVSLPFCGVGLGFAALGNLLVTYSPILKIICGIIASIITVVILIKILSDTKAFIEDLKNPIFASTFSTWSMAIMLLGGYLLDVNKTMAMVVWFLGIIIHIMIIVYFVKMFVLKFNLKAVWASWFIVFVGIVASCINAKPMGFSDNIGVLFFWFGFISLLVLLIVVTQKYMTIKEIPNPAKPLACIYTAPASLCLAGYMQVMEQKNAYIIYFLTVLSLILYIVALINLIKCIKLPFAPSYAAFTFPFVISAICIKMATNFYKNANPPFASVTTTIFTVQTVIAVCLCVYVLCRYLMAMSTAKK